MWPRLTVFARGSVNLVDSPTRSIGEDNITLLRRPLNEGHTGMLLPVPHGLAEYRPLAAWMGWRRGWDQWRPHSTHKELTHLSPFGDRKQSKSIDLSTYLHRWLDVINVRPWFSQTLQNGFQLLKLDQSNLFGGENKQLLRIGLTRGTKGQHADQWMQQHWCSISSSFIYRERFLVKR